jgi:hypothetical protein
MIQGYLKEIEELRAKLLESEAMCQQLRKTSLRTPPRGLLSSHVAMTGVLETHLKVSGMYCNIMAESRNGETRRGGRC